MGVIAALRNKAAVPRGLNIGYSRGVIAALRNKVAIPLYKTGGIYGKFFCSAYG